jgi:hypothetical protein
VVNEKTTFRVKHRDPYSGAGKFSDPADWDAAYVEPSQIDEIEPLPDVQNDYRTAAQTYLCLRLYAPKSEALTGKWNPPPVMRVQEVPPLATQ